jgi:hypothetical protein
MLQSLAGKQTVSHRWKGASAPWKKATASGGSLLSDACIRQALTRQLNQRRCSAQHQRRHSIPARAARAAEAVPRCAGRHIVTRI